MAKKIKFLKDLFEATRQGRQIVFFDEATTNMWEKLPSMYMPKDDYIPITLNKKRGRSCTILGAICKSWPKLKYILSHTTSQHTVAEYLTEYRCFFNEGAVLVLDNHRAHWSNKVRALAREMRIELLYLPTSSSECNPVEIMWSMFKRKWRRVLYDPTLDINEALESWLRTGN